MRRFLALTLGLGLLTTACAGDDPPAVSPPDATPGGDLVIELDGTEVVLTSSLAGFGDCDALLDHLRTEGAERVGPWGFEDGWFGPWPVDFMEVDMALEEVASDDDSGAAPAPPAAEGGDGAALTEGVDFSGTNLQEAGVDEADIVKTDGERVFIVASGELVVVDVASRTVTGSVAVDPGNRAELFLRGDDLLLLTQRWTGDIPVPFPIPDVAVDDIAADDIAEESLTADVIGPEWPGTEQTAITRITVDDGVPRVVETLAAEGGYVSARAVDGIARIVVRSNPQHRFPFVYPAGEAGEDRAEQANREAILASELTDWIPGYERIDASGATIDDGLVVPCDQVHAPTEFAGFGVLSVLTVPVDGPLDPSTTSSVLAPGETVYASPDSVFIATTTWLTPELADQDPQALADHHRTSIHRFDITSPDQATYTASGSVEGTVRDSFSFSEHDGHLRVVTTSGLWGADTDTFVRVLRESGGELVEVGAVGGMGRGEQVQSVRFQGDVGYVVTFRQIDPFYTLDLADPTDPRIVGELKIPGFSSYLHPIGDGLVLGVGSDADETTGRVLGTKVSLFDVTDLADPREIATWIGPDGWNEIGWDTHAFLWWAPENLAVIPMQVWQNGENWAGAVVLRVEGGTITEVGRIDHDDETAGVGQTECRVIGPEDLPTDDPSQFRSELEYSELEYMVLEDGSSLVLDCEAGEAPSATGYECYEEPWLAEEADAIGLRLEGTPVVCWPIGNGMPPISRSMVLPGGELWTVSATWGWLSGEGAARLQVNDLTTLERLGAIDV